MYSNSAVKRVLISYITLHFLEPSHTINAQNLLCRPLSLALGTVPYHAYYTEKNTSTPDCLRLSVQYVCLAVCCRK